MRRRTARLDGRGRPPRHRPPTQVSGRPAAGARLSPTTPGGANGSFNYGLIMDRLGEGRSWTPWLLIRYTQADAGQRPIPASDVYYASPDIWVQSSDPSGNAVPGETNFVYAAIFNLGKAPALPTRVDFYWGNPAIGLGPGQMNLIGTEWTQVQAHTIQVVRCNTPWIPIYENGGHECLIVNCTSPILDPIVQPFQTTLDRHVGQRNITVLQGGAGQIIKFSLGINNFFPLAAHVAVTARTEQVVVAPATLGSMMFREVVSRVATLDGQQTAAAPKATKQYHVARTAVHLRTRVSRPIRVVPTKGARGYLGHLFLEADRISAVRRRRRSHDKTLHDITMEAFEQRRLDLQLSIPANARPGAFIVVHLVQSALGLPMGGYTIVVQVGARRAVGTASIARLR